MSSSRLAIGTAQIGLTYGVANTAGRPSFSQAKATIHEAFANQIHSLDTAAAYGDSESILGKIGVRNWSVTTKLPPALHDISQTKKDCIPLGVERSLNNLQLDSIYGLLLHDASILRQQGGQTVYEQLQSEREKGHVQKIGVSVYSPEELRLLLSSFDFDIVQIPYNIFDRRLVASGLLDELKQRGIEVHVRSIFLQGLLLMPATSRPKKFQRWKKLWDRWDQWLATSGTTALQSCLQFALAEPAIDRIIVGVETVRQLHEIIDAASTTCPSIPDELMCSDTMLLNPSQWTAL